MTVKSTAMSIVEAMRTLSSVFSTRSKFAGRAGRTFCGNRDMYEALGYKLDLEPADYRDRFERGDIAGRVVDAYPNATWRGGAEVFEDEDPKVETEFEVAWKELNERLNIWSVFNRADILAGLGEYAIIVIGAPGDLATELPKNLKPEAIAYLQAYGQDTAVIQDYDEDVASPRFGEALTYTLTLQVGKTQQTSKLVHWTRVIHIADGVLDNKVLGTPRLKKVWNRLDDLDKVLGGGAEAFWKRADQGIIFNLDKETEFAPGEDEKVKQAAEDFQNGYRRVMATRGMTAMPMGSDVANFNPQADAILTVISGSTGIPKRILMGSERGELASTQDRENWKDRVSDRQKDFGYTVVVRPFVQRMIEHGVLVEPEQWEVEWRDHDALTEMEKSDKADVWSKLNAQSRTIVVTGAEIRENCLGLEPLTDEEIQAELDLLSNSSIAANPIVPDPNKDPNADPSKGGSGAPPEPGDTGEKPQDPNKGRALRGLSVVPVLAIVDDHEPHARMDVYAALQAARSSVNVHVLTSELFSAGPVAVYGAHSAAMGQLRRVLEGRLLDELALTYDEGRELAVDGMRTARKRKGVEPTPEGKAWSTKNVGKLIEGIDAGQRAAIKELVDTALTRGWKMETLARRVERIIGLDDRRARAVENARTRLSANPGKLVQVGDIKLKVPKNVSEDWLDRRMDAYANKLLRQRARSIANTETMTAVNDGRREAWRAAREEGDIPAKTVRVLHNGPNPCPFCQELDGATAPIDGFYDLPDGAESLGPPFHTSCMCWEELFLEERMASNFIVAAGNYTARAIEGIRSYVSQLRSFN